MVQGASEICLGSVCTTPEGWCLLLFLVTWTGVVLVFELLDRRGRLDAGVIGDFVKWCWLPTKRFRRQWWGGCSMGPSIEAEKHGRIVKLRTARVDTECDQKGTTYAHIEYADGSHDRLPVGCLWHDKRHGRYSYSV